MVLGICDKKEGFFHHLKSEKRVPKIYKTENKM